MLTLPDLIASLAWYMTSVAVGLLALPLTFQAFRRLPDRGYSLAKPLGLLVVGYVFWLLGSLGFLRNDVPGILFAAGLVGAGGLAWLGSTGRATMRAWLIENRRLVVGVEAVYLVAFAALVFVRAHNPDILHTEKPMEYMFLNAILRSDVFPPHDAWLSGHAISYYHFGYILIAGMARVTATSSEVAFNLGLALLFALTAVAALGVTLNLIALVLPRAAQDDAPRLRRAFWPALLGPLFVLVVGNFYGLVQVAHVNGLLADTRIPAVRYYFGANDPANAGLAGPGPAEPGIRAEMVNVWDWLDLKLAQRPLPARSAQFRWDTGGNWFFAARVVHDRDLLGKESEAIDENPAFSFILGDMHPHVLALPFVVLAAALALDWLLWAWSGGQGGRLLKLELAELRRRGTLARVALAALVLGGLSFLNTWDFPIYLFLTVLALALGLGLRLGWQALVTQLPALAVTGIGLALLSVLLYLPFYITFQSQAGGILPNLIWPTRFQQTVVFFGPVMIGVTVYMAWLAYRGRALLDRRAALWAGLGLVGVLLLAVVVLTAGGALNASLAAEVDRHVAPLTRNQALRLALLRRLVDSAATLFPALLIGLAAGLAVGVMRRVPPPDAPADTPPEMSAAPPSGRPWRRQPTADPSGPLNLAGPAVLMVLALVLTGALLMLGPEYVYLRDNFGWRMNTLFKFYFQTWTLWALAAAFGVWHIAHAARPIVRAAGVGLVALALFLGLLYTFPALQSRTVGFRGPASLNGMGYFARDYPDDWAAIAWLRQNAVGAAVIAEAEGSSYQVHLGRISMATGLPTIMGWTGHQSQWRGTYYGSVAERPGLLSTLYQVRDWGSTLAVIDRYNIEYVIVGPSEHGLYTVYLPKFEQNMDLVFESGGTLVFQRKPGSQP